VALLLLSMFCSRMLLCDCSMLCRRMLLCDWCPCAAAMNCSAAQDAESVYCMCICPGIKQASLFSDYLNSTIVALHRAGDMGSCIQLAECLHRSADCEWSFAAYLQVVPVW
jgi:hypothetical protein